MGVALPLLALLGVAFSLSGAGRRRGAASVVPGSTDVDRAVQQARAEVDRAIASQSADRDALLAALAAARRSNSVAPQQQQTGGGLGDLRDSLQQALWSPQQGAQQGAQQQQGGGLLDLARGLLTGAQQQQQGAQQQQGGGLLDLARGLLGSGGGTQGSPSNLTRLSGAGGGAYSATQVQAAEALRTYLASGGDPGRTGHPAERVRVAQRGMGGLTADGIAGPLTVGRMSEILNAAARGAS